MSRWSSGLNIIAVWVLTSLLAIALVGSHPYLALTVAILGGAAMGLLAVLSHEAGPWPRDAEREGEKGKENRL